MALPVPVPDPCADPVIVRAAGRVIVAAEPIEIVEARGPAAFDVLDHLSPGWWAGLLTYDLGRAVELVTSRLPVDLDLPDLLLARYEARLVLGDGAAWFEGDPGVCVRLRRLIEAAPPLPPLEPLGPAESSLDRDAFEAGVRAVVALIEAGECYQVNLTRRLTWDRPAHVAALFGALSGRSPAPHASLLSLPRAGSAVGVASASPELFLSWRGRSVRTRPIKGTARDARWLAASRKDRAENVMIVDLARNDLGRVCEYGSVEVPALCAIESHPGLHHLVSTVQGEMRPDVTLGALVRATFPPASVTGAPKPRALQAIEDLEPVRRGVYCGALGCIDTERGDGDFALAIRTFTVSDSRTSLGVGGGIVADSDPGAEWDETELKAARLLAAAGASTPRRRERSERRSPASERPRRRYPPPQRASET